MHGTEKSTAHPRVDLLAGGLSGGFTRFIIAPLDVVKIRFQIQVEPTSRLSLQRAKYYSVSQAIRTIYQEEGLTALWKGNLTATFLWISYGAIQFAAYQQIVKYLGDTKVSTGSSTLDRMWSSLVGGGAAGAVATGLTYPLDLVRTRLASQSEPKIYKGLGDAFSKIIQTNGVKGLFRGLVPTTLEIIPYISLQFMFYEECKWMYSQTMNIPKDNIGSIGHLLCGATAGTLAKVMVLPLDTLKKRMQISGFDRGYGEKVVVNGMADCARKIIQREGYRGFYKGLVPSLYKAAPAAALAFASYEYSKKFLLSLTEPGNKG